MRRATVYNENGWLLRDGRRLRGSEPEAPLRLNLAELEILTSGFALRDDDLWKRAMQLDLAEYHQCDVASVPYFPRIDSIVRTII